MKPLRCLLLAALLLLTCVGCSDQKPPAPETTPAETTSPVPTVTPAPTPEPTPSPTPEPDGEPAVAKADRVGVIAVFLNRGDTVQVTGEYDQDFCEILMDGQTLLVEKRFIRMDDDAVFESRTGYSQKDAAVYASAYLTGNVLTTLSRNAVVTILEDLGGCYLIEFDGQQGYVRTEQISNKKLSSGGGSGSGGADGGDIVLGAFDGGMSIVRLSVPRMEQETPAAFAPGGGTVLADRVEAYRLLLNRGDAVKVIAEEDGFSRVLVDGQIGLAETRLLRMEAQGAYTAWDGYAQNKAAFYENYRLIGESESLKKNTAVHVVEDLGDCYLAEVDGALGCIPRDQVSETKIQSSGGGGGGGEWTEPVL